MKLFSKLYDQVIDLCQHKRASLWLAIVSFTESSFFLIPPDVMLLPMSIAQSRLWIRLACITTIASVLGGLFGYLLGAYLLNAILPFIDSFDYRVAYDTAFTWFQDYGIWVVLLAGITPIPYKIFTIASGAFGVSIIGFIAMSLLGRGLRFFTVAYLGQKFGTVIAERLYRYFDWIGWTLVTLILAYLAYLWL